jgi:hypothetical protein
MKKGIRTSVLVACYNLSDEALMREKPATTKKQYIAVSIDEKEAIRTGYLRRKWKSNDSAFDIYDATDFLLCKIEPNLTQLGVTRSLAVPEFDHILSETEAQEMIEREMARYDEVLTVSRAAYNERVYANTIMVTLPAVYNLTEEAHRELFLTGPLEGTPVAREQRIDVTVSAREALRTGYIRLDDKGYTFPTQIPIHTFAKLRPDLSQVGVLRQFSPAFDHILTSEEATKLVEEEMARYDMVLDESKVKIEADQKSRKENEEKEAEKRRKEIDDFLTDLNYYMPMIERDVPHVIDAEHTNPEWFEIDGLERVILRYDLASDDPGSAWSTNQAKETREFFRKEQEKQDLEEIATWIKEHGSPRLKKILTMGLMKNPMRAYHLERLAIELPGWDFLTQPTKEQEDPTENEIDALILAREKWPEGNVGLVLVPLYRVERIPMMPQDTKWGPALIMRCPWDKNNLVRSDLDQKIQSEVDELSKEPEAASR